MHQSKRQPDVTYALVGTAILLLPSEGKKWRQKGSQSIASQVEAEVEVTEPKQQGLADGR